jgi:hypothetical protein
VEKAVASWAERDEVGVEFGTAPFVRAVVHLKRNAPGAAFVESDQAAEGGELTIEGCQYGLLLGEFDIRDEALNPHQVERPHANNLVGDRDVAAPRIVRFRLHRDSLARPLLPCEEGSAGTERRGETNRVGPGGEPNA